MIEEETHTRSSFAAAYHSKPKPLLDPKSKSKSKSKTSNKDVNDLSSLSSEYDKIIPIDSQGLISFTSTSGLKRHPVELLIEKGRKVHQEIEARIAGITELRDAVEDYEKSWGMKPPKGFDYWYAPFYLSFHLTILTSLQIM